MSEKFFRHWNALNPKDQRILTWGAVFFATVVVYFVIFQPWQNHLESVRKRVADRVATLATMQKAALEVAVLRSSASFEPHPGVQGVSLLSLVDLSARKKGLGSELKQVEPDGPESVRMLFENVSFHRLMTWMVEVSRQGVSVLTVTMDKEKEPGRVKARLVLARPGE
ncbi:MAG: type II secretion system protein M [Magnetococcus sp. XQGC-1]